MKPMLMTLIASLFASPVLAHPGAHLHPHGSSSTGLILGLGVLSLVIAVTLALKVRK